MATGSTRFRPGSARWRRARGAPYAAIADDERRFYGVVFHPEVAHTPQGGRLLRNFTHHVAGCHGEWTIAAFRAQAVGARPAAGWEGRVVCGLSGGGRFRGRRGLAAEAIGDQVTCIFVDTGLLRLGEAEEVVRLFRGHYNIPLVHRDAGALFLEKLSGITDPEESARSSARPLSMFSNAEAQRIGGVEFLAQGTLYPDVIESVSATGGPSVTIKSHHNVGGAAGPHEFEAGRAVARSCSRTRCRLGPRTGPPRPFRRSPTVSRPGPGDPHSRRSDGRATRHPAPRRRGLFSRRSGNRRTL